MRNDLQIDVSLPQMGLKRKADFQHKELAKPEKESSACLTLMGNRRREKTSHLVFRRRGFNETVVLTPDCDSGRSFEGLVR
jgi:hypothetical protein